MIKGRRTRNAGKSAVTNSTKLVMDDTASPKRKDLKYNKEQSDLVGAVQPIKKPPHAREPMLLRGGRLKTVDISHYMQSTERLKNAAVIESASPPRIESIIDITDENTCDAFPVLSSNSNKVLLTAVATRNTHDEHRIIGPKKSSSYSNGNNIFLQEPASSLNLDKTPTQQNRTLTMMQKHFQANSSQEIKTSLFSSPPQPKIDSLWQNTSVTANCNFSCLDQQHVLIKSLEQHALDLSKPTQVTHIDSTTSTMEMLLNQNDTSNSCDSGDSGVVILSGNDGHTSSSSSPAATESKLVLFGNQTNSGEKRKKPATPHRILCPSPIKHAVICPSNLISVTKSSASGLKGHGVSNKTGKRFNARIAEIGSDIEKPVPLSNGFKNLPSAETDLLPLHAELSTTIEKKLSGSNFQLIVEPTNGKSSSGGNKKITEFYPVRRSVRKTKKEVQVERDRDIEQAIREEREKGLKIENFEGKGRGIVTTRFFCKGEFVVEYIGDLISVSEAKQREQMYAEDDNTGCYMYYFKHKNLQHCIDATAESGKLGRLVNHSRNGNLVTKTVSLNNRPHLVLIAKEDIDKGVEVTYDYGDRSKEALQYYPWLAL